jgi:hypothetical protein
MECERNALRERSELFPARRLLAACLVRLGQLDQARTVISGTLKAHPQTSISKDAYGYATFARPADQERYVVALRQAGLPE